MKRYVFIRMEYKFLKGGYVTSKQDGYRDHRTVIAEMASQGWRFVGQIPIEMTSYGKVTFYDLVFEREEL